MKQTSKIKKLVSLFMAVVLFSVATISASAASTYIGIDDDDAQGYGNDSFGTWTRVYNSNLKYGEGLYTQCNDSRKFYEWIYNPIGGKNDMYVTLSVWLYDSTFNDPAASYYVEAGYVYNTIGTVNQNTAPAGWTDFPQKVLKCRDAGGNNISHSVRMYPSTRGSKYTCGADWVEATLYHFY